MTSTDRDSLVQHTKARCTPEEHDDRRIDDIELLKQVDSAVSDVRRARSAAGRAVLQRVGQVDGLVVEADVSDRPTQPLSRAAHEWPARLRFLPAWSFTHKHDLRIRVALTHDRLA